MFFVVHFDAPAQTSDFRIERRQVVFLYWKLVSKSGRLRHQIASWLIMLILFIRETLTIRCFSIFCCRMFQVVVLRVGHSTGAFTLVAKSGNSQWHMCGICHSRQNNCIAFLHVPAHFKHFLYFFYYETSARVTCDKYHSSAICHFSE